MILKRLMITVALVLTPAFVLAAKPNRQACLGKDFSNFVQGGGGFGKAIAQFARNIPGIGLGIQSYLAGQISDNVIPNSCND